MKAVLQVYDKPLTGDPELRRSLSFGSDWVTGADLIRRRIEDEIAESWHEISHNQEGRTTLAAGKGWLVAPDLARENPPPGEIIERHINFALEAFQQDGFFMIVDDTQVTDLDRPLNLRSDSRVVFIRLKPLVSG